MPVINLIFNDPYEMCLLPFYTHKVCNYSCTGAGLLYVKFFSYYTCPLGFSPYHNIYSASIVKEPKNLISTHLNESRYEEGSALPWPTGYSQFWWIIITLRFHDIINHTHTLTHICDVVPIKSSEWVKLRVN